MQFAKFMASTTGRAIRIVAGLALIGIGWLGLAGTTTGYVLIGVGLVPLLAGIFDVCVFAPIFGGAFKGSAARNRTK